MQTVSWENLSPISQHEGFVREVRLMFNQADSFRLLLQNPSDNNMKYNRGSIELRQRAEIRNASYRVHPFGAERFTSESDVVYKEARDSIPDSAREREACYTATLVDKWSCRLTPYNDLFHQIQVWGLDVYGPKSNFEFKFDKRWLESPGNFLPELFCSMQQLLSTSNASEDRFGITIFLANLAHSKHGNIPLVHTLLALATAPELRNIRPPTFNIIDLSKGFRPDEIRLTRILESCRVSFEDSPDISMPRLPHEHEDDFADRRRASYEAATKFQVKRCLRDLMRQWPVRDFVLPQTPEINTYLPRLRVLEETIQSLFKSWFQNFEFRNYIQDIQDVLDSLSQPPPMPRPYSIPPQVDTYKVPRAYVKIADLLPALPPEFPLPQDDLEGLVTTNGQPEVDTGPSKLKSLLAKLSRSAQGHYQKLYIKDLQKSHNAFLANTPPSLRLASATPHAFLKRHLEQCRENVDSMYKKICTRLTATGARVYDSARKASMLPRLSPNILLRLLARLNPVELSLEWRVALTRYALAIASMQRAERLVACGKRESDILNELSNVGHTNWDPMEYPEWLLLELESNLLIRPEQGTHRPLPILSFSFALQGTEIIKCGSMVRAEWAVLCTHLLTFMSGLLLCASGCV